MGWLIPLSSFTPQGYSVHGLCRIFMDFKIRFYRPTSNPVWTEVLIQSDNGRKHHLTINPSRYWWKKTYAQVFSADCLSLFRLEDGTWSIRSEKKIDTPLFYVSFFHYDCSGRDLKAVCPPLLIVCNVEEIRNGKRLLISCHCFWENQHWRHMFCSLSYR